MNIGAGGHDRSLQSLETRIRRDLAAIELPSPEWMRPQPGPDGRTAYDVVIVGAGLSGLSIGFGLRRHGITNVAIIDRSPEGAEGPWVTCARMATLRSPKQLTGPDLGIPSLTFRSWYEALAGAERWEGLGKIPPKEWMAYLSWYRRVLALPVRNEVCLKAIESAGDFLALQTETAGGTSALYSRRVVLATGIDGCGRPHVPRLVTSALPPDRYTHSAEMIDHAILSGDIGVLGGGSSAFDWASAALDGGARSVTLFVRREALAKTEALAWTNFSGFLGAFADLDDLRRWRFMRRFFELQPPPTQEMFDRVIRNPCFRMITGAPLRRLSMEGDCIRADGDDASWTFDHLLLGTGFETDLTCRPEFAAWADRVALWGDRLTPPAGEEDMMLARHPYLGPAFELTERVPGTAPELGRIHIFNNGAVPSLGPICNGVTGLKYGVPRITGGIARKFFLEDADRHLASLMAYDEAHFRVPAELDERQ